MISILTQERLLGAALGAAFTALVVFEQRKRIYDSLSPHNSQFDSQSQMREPIFGKQFRSEFELMWNKAVDQTFGLVIASVNSRRRCQNYQILLLKRGEYPIIFYLNIEGTRNALVLLFLITCKSQNL